MSSAGTPSTAHAVVTRFSYRGAPAPNDSAAFQGWLIADDPLEPRRLDFRFLVFEITCAASLLAQTNQDFDWILIVDRDLPRRHRSRLELLLRDRPRTHLHVYEPGEDLGSARWLMPYVSPGRERILTTQLDDDDALPVNFLEVLRARLDREGTYPILRTAASRRSEQWELVASARAPLGYRCQWHRGNWVVSTGLSLSCPDGPDALTVLALNHQIADFWSCTLRDEALRSLLVEKWGLSAQHASDATRFVADQLAQFQTRARSAIGGSELPGDAAFVDLTEDVGPVVVSNHFLNDQFMRLLEPKPDRISIAGPQSFPNVTLGFGRFRDSADMFRKTWPGYRRIVRLLLPKARSWHERARMLAWASWRYLRV
jgi:hypothetical protein